ncbi:MAG: hypothetical protein ABGY24_02215 [bacterium]
MTESKAVVPEALASVGVPLMDETVAGAEGSRWNHLRRKST